MPDTPPRGARHTGMSDGHAGKGLAGVFVGGVIVVLDLQGAVGETEMLAELEGGGVEHRGFPAVQRPGLIDH